MICGSRGFLAEKHARRKASSILTLWLFCRLAWAGTLHRGPGLDREKRPRIVRRVTFVQRQRRNMSHRFSVLVPWHGCCSYPGISGAAAPLGSTASQGNRLRNAGSGTKATRRTPRAPDNNEKTLLHTSKRPTTPHPAGFFFARAIVDEIPATDKGRHQRRRRLSASSARTRPFAPALQKKEAAFRLPRI